MVQCAADVADYSFVWIHVAEPTSQPPTICIAVAKPTFQLGATQRVIKTSREALRTRCNKIRRLVMHYCARNTIPPIILLHSLQDLGKHVPNEFG